MILKWAAPPELRKLHLPQHSSQLSSSNGTYVNILQAKQYADINYTLDDIPGESMCVFLLILLIYLNDSDDCQFDLVVCFLFFGEQ